MTMHVVLGDGQMPVKELNQHLQNLKDADVEADQPFWFLVQAKAEPTSTDQALMKWLNDNDIYYQTISDGSEVEGIYTNAQETYEVKRLSPKIVSLMQTTPEEGEDAHVLALFVSDDPDAAEDRWLNDTVQAVSEAGFKIFALNDGMVEIDLEDVEGEAEEVEAEEIAPEEPSPVKAKKAAAKKAAASPAVDDGVDEAAAAGKPNRDDLEQMDLSQLKEVAAKAGITLPPRTRMGTYIDAILGQMPEEIATEVEIEEVEVPEEDSEVESERLSFSPGTFSTGTSMNGSITLTSGSVASPSMLIVVHNGTVVSRAITSEQALELISG